MPPTFQAESAELAAPAPPSVVAEGISYLAHLRTMRGLERGGEGIASSHGAAKPGPASLAPCIKRAISDFYTFGEADTAFPPFPVHFTFEERRLSVRFPNLVGIGLLAGGDQFCGLLATIAGLLRVNSYGRSGAMRELLLLAAEGKELSTAGTPFPRLELRIVGANMAEIWFESEEL